MWHDDKTHVPKGFNDQQHQPVFPRYPSRVASIVRSKFGLTGGEPRMLDEIGHIHGVTRKRIRQIKSKTIAKPRHPSRSQGLRNYLG
jgi:RNA polymerase primary sigma factor